MSQHDLDIANQSATAFRSDLNLALKALGSLNSGTLAPSAPYANMLWYDTTADLLKVRNEANDDWITIGKLNQSLKTFELLDGTIVTTTGGTEVARLAVQDQTVWNTGLVATESFISPVKLKAAVETHSPIQTSGWEFYSNYLDTSVDGAVNFWQSASLLDGYDYRLLMDVVETNGFFLSVYGSVNTGTRKDYQFTSSFSGAIDLVYTRQNTTKKFSTRGVTWTMDSSEKIEKFEIRAVSGSIDNARILIQRIKSVYS